MKSGIISLLIFLSLDATLSSGKEVELPDEGWMDSDLPDMDNMLTFSKSFMSSDSEKSLQEKIDDSIPDAVMNNADEILGAMKKYVDAGKNWNKLQETGGMYIKRYINLFLLKGGLQDVPESDEDIKINLIFSITKEDLLFLQDLSKDVNMEKLQNVLYRLDTIFDNGLELKTESLLEKSISFGYFIKEHLSIPPSWYYSKTFCYVVVLVATLLLLFIMNYGGISKYIIVSTIYNNFILLEGVIDYLNKLKEEETSDYVRMLEAKKCNPGEETFWSSITGWFRESDCHKYHMAFVKSETQDVSPLKCILDSYKKYLFQYPFNVLGSCINGFSSELNASSYFPSLMTFGTNYVILSMIAVIVFSLLISRIKLSFFGATMEIDMSKRTPSLPTNRSEYIECRRIEEIRGSDVASGERTERETCDRLRIKGCYHNQDQENSTPAKSIGEPCPTVEERSGQIEGVAESETLKDISNVREILNSMKKKE